VLELGSVPLPVVTARIDRFIAEGGKSPYPDMERIGLGCLESKPIEVDTNSVLHSVVKMLAEQSAVFLH
jgi:hypothetical protein